MIFRMSFDRVLSPSSRGLRTREAFAVALASISLAASSASAQQGTWTALPADSATGGTNGNELLLTDGRVFFNQGGVSPVWSIYTPDAKGHYETGTWSSAPSAAVGASFYSEAVLADGRVWVAGGEYVTPGNDHATVQWYDPVANTWTQGQDLPFGGDGDNPYQMLADGRVLLGGNGNQFSQIFDPNTNSVSLTGGELAPSTVGEATWVLLADGTVLDFTWAPPQKYLPSTGQWIDVATPPVTLWDANKLEIGPGLLLYTGQVFAIGGTGHTALYTPGAHPTDPGSWTAGPDLPPSSTNPGHPQFADDAPACIEPNGKVLFVSSDDPYGAPLFNEYDPIANTITPIAGPPAFPGASFALQMLALPTGQILLTGTGTNDYLYTPLGGPAAAWKPTIQSVTAQPDGSYLLTGTQLNGLSQGAAYGDDGFAETNYPLVRLVDAQNNVFYAKTYGMSTMGVATGSATVSTSFKLPAGLPAGSYSLVVVANGIASQPIDVRVDTSSIP